MNVQIIIDGKPVEGVLYHAGSGLLVHLPGFLAGKSRKGLCSFGELFTQIIGKKNNGWVHIGEWLERTPLRRGPDGWVYARVCESPADLPPEDKVLPGYLRCPVCKGSGAVSVPAPEFTMEEGWGEQAKARCDLCWGTGIVPKPQVYGEGEVQFVLGWWDCKCEQDYIHPENHDHCTICGAIQEDQPPSRANEVRRHLTTVLGVEQQKRSPTITEADGLVCSGCDQVFECVKQQPGGDECQARRLS